MKKYCSLNFTLCTLFISENRTTDYHEKEDKCWVFDAGAYTKSNNIMILNFLFPFKYINPKGVSVEVTLTR